MALLQTWRGRVTSLAFVLAIGSVSSATADNWPSWRGPHGNGICDEGHVAYRWNRTENVAWRLALPGPGGSTPAVWEDRIFLTAVEGDELLLLCASTDGEELWRRVVGVGNKNVRNDEGNFASPSASTDGEFVWSMMSSGDIGCYDFDGEEVWKLDLQDRYGPFQISFGMTATPVLYGDRLFLQLVHGDRKADTHEARIVALDKRTGAELWQAHRITGAYGENELSYASPMLYDDTKMRFLVTHGADFVIAYDLNDGHEIWRCGGLNPHDDPKKRYHPTLRFVASPAMVPGMIVVPTAKNGPVIALRPHLMGDLTENADAYIWKRPDNTPDVPCPLIHDGLVYLCRENGNLICLEAKTGQELYQERTNRERHRASPVYADGRVYLTARDGKVTVVKTGRDFEILAQNDLEEPQSSSPAISNGTIYLRTFEALWAIREPN